MPLEPIHVSDLDDPRIEVFRNVRDRDLRGRRNDFIAESELVLRRLLASGIRVRAVLISPNRLQDLRADLERLPGDVGIYVAEIELLTRIVGFFVHRGVLAAGYRPEASELTIKKRFAHLRERVSFTLIGAEGITNVDNMGGLFRNAAVFGADGIILDPTCCDPLYRKAIRVSMGHVFSVPYAVSTDWPADLERLSREWSVRLIAAEVTDSAHRLEDLSQAPRMLLIFGSEGEGLSDETLGMSDDIVCIPTQAGSSLNVAVSSAVFLYERGRSSGEARG